MLLLLLRCIFCISFCVFHLIAFLWSCLCIYYFFIIILYYFCCILYYYAHTTFLNLHISIYTDKCTQTQSLSHIDTIHTRTEKKNTRKTFPLTTFIHFIQLILLLAPSVAHNNYSSDFLFLHQQWKNSKVF